jgi:serine/threonine protein kinase
MEAGILDRLDECRRLAYAMVTSIAHVHSCHCVHGDVKPSNWLWDDELKVPLLADLETVKVCRTAESRAQHSSTVAPTIRTEEFTAPELRMSPDNRPTPEADVYALGLSIREVIQHLMIEVYDRRPVAQKLHELVYQMISEDPGQRPKANCAQGVCWKLVAEPIKGESEIIVFCEDITLYHTQSSIGPKFQDGKTFGDLIDTVVRDHTYPLQDSRLVLNVVRKGQVLMSMDNRRLYCFRQAQRQLDRGGSTLKVMVKVRVHTFEPWMDKYWRNLDEDSNGMNVRVRGGRSFYNRSLYNVRR